MYSRRELLRAAVSLAVPNRCPFCDVVVGAFEYMHEECLDRLPRITEKISPPKGIEELYACFWYDEAARDAVLRLKDGHYIHAAEAFAPIMLEAAGGAVKSADMITAVPSDLYSKVKRGYVPAEAIAKEISRRCGVRYAAALRTDKRREQKRLSAEERAENVRDAFGIINKKLIFDKNILLVDDICTTGSTLSECARVLRENGAASVSAAVFTATRSVRLPEGVFRA